MYDLIVNRDRPYKWHPYRHLVHPWYKVFVKGARHFTALQKACRKRTRTPYVCECNRKDYLTSQHLQRHRRTKMHERNMDMVRFAASLELDDEETSPKKEEISSKKEEISSKEGTNKPNQSTEADDGALAACISCIHEDN